MPEHLRIGDIVVELRPSYGASVGCEVKIETLSIHGKPDEPTVTLSLRLDRPDHPPAEEEDLEEVEIIDVIDVQGDKIDYIAELDNIKDEEPSGGNA